jgi:PAS domain S-box-containing protein
MKLMLTKTSLLIYLLAVTVLVILLLLFYKNNNNVHSTTGLVIHTQLVLSKSNDILLDVLNIETAVRGFILSKDETFLEPYNASIQTIGTHLKDIKTLTMDNPRQQILVDSMIATGTLRTKLIEKEIALVRAGKMSISEKEKDIMEGKRLTDKIRLRIAALNAEEFRLLQERKIANDKSIVSYNLLFILICSTIIFLTFIVFYILRNQKIRNEYAKILEAQVTERTKELDFQNNEKEDRANELIIANKELAFQNNEKEDRANELIIANRELAFQNNEKEDRANELIIANKELAFQNNEKEDRANELIIANKELAFQNNEKEDRANELIIANKELAFQNNEKEDRANELIIANEELAFQNNEKEDRANELIIANEELAFQNNEKEDRANELVIANKELLFQNKEKEKRAAELVIANYARTLIEASHDPLITISTEGKIMDVNKAMELVSEKTKSILINTPFENYFTDEMKAKAVYEEVFEKGFVSDYPLTLKDGKLIDVLFNGSVYKNADDQVLGAVIVARDVTEQKRISVELNEAKVFAELATGIAEVAKAKAEDAVKSKQQFLSNMSHEIRTPMNAIIGFTKVILKTELTVHQREYLSAIKLSGDALIVLINDILDLAKVNAGKLAFEKTPFTLVLSMNAMMHLFEPKLAEKNIKLIKIYDDTIPEVIEGDPVRLHQIIINLLSNAVKFTNEGFITVNVALVSETKENVTISFTISDTGIGIAANKLDSIFENFQQASSNTTRVFGGTGLGLAIVKQLVEGQNGTIKVSSIEDKGSSFTATMAFAKTNKKAIEEEALLELDETYKNIKVLVVEDILLNQLLMKTLLDDFGFECQIVSNGKLAIEALQAQKYDIVLMDLQMPEMNGFEATDFIRNTMMSTIPIIALTADVTTVDVEKCKQAGMNDYISKPVDEKILYTKIISNVKKPAIVMAQTLEPDMDTIKLKCIDLAYLMVRTKSEPKMMSEIINAFLVQTPELISTIKQSVLDKDWKQMRNAVHKMIPSFAIMGMNAHFEGMAKKIQEFANTELEQEDIGDLIMQLEKECLQACEELKIELIRINK